MDLIFILFELNKIFARNETKFTEINFKKVSFIIFN